MPEEQLKILQNQILSLQHEIQLLSAVLQGSTSLDTVGVFKRLKDLEQLQQTFNSDAQSKIYLIEESIHRQIELTKKEFQTNFGIFEREQEQSFSMILKKIETNSTALTNTMMEIHMWRNIFGIFKSRYFWRVFIATLFLIIFGKSWYAILEELKTLLQ